MSCQRQHVQFRYQNTWFAKLFETYPLFDGALSFILCFATNLATLELTMCLDHPLPMTRFVLGNMEWGVSDPDTPFQHLKLLDMAYVSASQFAYDVPILPSVETLYISDNAQLRSFATPSQPVGTCNLSSVFLDHVNIDPELIVKV
jgi:hypothetical protein